MLASSFLASGALGAFLAPVTPTSQQPRASRHVLQQIIFADSPDPPKPENFRTPNSKGTNRATQSSRGVEADELDTSEVRSTIIGGSPKSHSTGSVLDNKVTDTSKATPGSRSVGADELDTTDVRSTIISGGPKLFGTGPVQKMDPSKQVRPGDEMDVDYIRGTILAGKQSPPANPNPTANTNTAQGFGGTGYSSGVRSTEMVGKSNVPGTIIPAGPVPAPPQMAPPPPPPSPTPEPQPARVHLSREERDKIDYATQIRTLTDLLTNTEQKMAEMKLVATRIKEMELRDPTLASLPEGAVGLKNVLSEAKAAAEVHGPNSPEALAAWKDVEECAAGQECSLGTAGYRYSAAAIKAHHYYNVAVDSVFLQEAIDAFDTLDNLRRFVQFENDRLSRDASS